MRYRPDHEEPSSNHHKEDGTPGGDHHHKRDRERNKELKRVRDTKEQQKNTPRRPRGK